MPMTVEMAAVKRGDLSAHLTVVGNLIGLQTVEVAPKTGGRLQTVSVQLGDAVRRGQVMAKIEDREILEQVNQAEASLEVVEGDDPAARGRPQSRGAQLRALEEPLPAAAARQAVAR